MATAQDYKERGNAYYNRQEYDEAVSCYAKAVDLDPTNHAVYTNRAAAHFALQNFADALADAAVSTELEPAWTKGHYRAGAALTAMARYDEAVEAFQCGISKDPTNAQLKAGLAAAVRMRNEQPKDHHDAKARGNGCYKEGRYEEAIVWYSKGIAACDAATEPEFTATLLTNRAECNRQLCEIKAVVRDCTAALQLAPRNLKAFLRRGLAHEFLEKYDDAAADFKHAMAIDPGGAVASEGLRRVTSYRHISVAAVT
mmetsp:Transcript_17440/g.43172  ORF Transcript_17440/g.43172 Transcript_17440/m.43172 type:complete len:256 (-) Transcript_17440:193-960(-)